MAQDLSPIDTFFTTPRNGADRHHRPGDRSCRARRVNGIMFLGRMNMGFAVSICVGLVLLFGAATVLSGFA